MLRESMTAVIARGERWSGRCASEPLEAGWATEAIVFIRALRPPVGAMPRARVELSPDGMHWLASGIEIAFPDAVDAVTMARIGGFGNWLRVAAELPDGAAIELLITLHLK
jgi:hypothetical protein